MRHQQYKLSKATSFLFPAKMIAKLEWTQSNTQQNRTISESHNGSNNQQQQTHCLRTDSNLSHWGGGLNAFYWY